VRREVGKGFSSEAAIAPKDSLVPVPLESLILHMKLSKSPFLLFGSLALGLLAACSGGGGGGGGASAVAIDESEPNDTFGNATALVVGETGHGTVADNTDSDFWQVTLGANEIVSIEVFGNRFDQTAWEAGSNATKVQILDTDGATLLLEQGAIDFDWNSDQDTDVVAFRAPAAGTYFLQVDVDDTLGTGGEYLLSVQANDLPTPLQFEQELEGATGDNDSDATAEALVPGTLAGFHVDDESDWYTFDITVPTLVTFTMHGHRDGIWKGDDGLYDPEINLIDTDGLTNLRNNDDTFYLDSSIQYVLNTAGTYFLEVTECCGSGDSGYLLEFQAQTLASLGEVAEVEPNDASGTAQAVQFGDYVEGSITAVDGDFYSVSCNAGDRVLVQVFDLSHNDAAVGSVTVVIEDSLAATLPVDFDSGLHLARTILSATGTFFVHVTAAGTTDYALHITQAADGFESEPNDLAANAGAFDANGRAAGVMDAAADADLFAFQATAGVPVVFSCLADESNSPDGYFEVNGFGSDLDPALSVQDALGTVLTGGSCFNGNALAMLDGEATMSLVFLPPATGTYYLSVEDYNDAFGATFFYALQKR